MTGAPPAEAEPQVGDRMRDGTRYAGISPDTEKPMYTTSQDALPAMKWLEAMG